jgi:hypothetical protein
MSAFARNPILVSLGVALALAAGTATAETSELADAADTSRSKPIDPAARMPRPTTAQIDNTLAVGGEDIAARKVRSRMTVPVKVNGTGPYRFVVDSGADTSVVGLRIADALKLPPSGRVLLNGVTDSSYVDRVDVDEIALGPTSVSDLHLPVLRETDIGADGMIGLDALVEQRLVLDFEARTIAVDDGLRPLPRLRGDTEIVVTARLKKGQLILTEVKAGQTQLDAVIDTGSEITIGNSALRDKLARRYPSKVEKIEVTGVTGVVTNLELIRVPELRLGSVTLRNVPIAFADVTPFEVFGISHQPALLLGTDLMENFRKVSLDFRARKVRFQLRKCQPISVRISTMPGYATRLSSEESAVCAR